MKKVYILAVIAALLFGALMYLYLSGSATASTSTDEKKTVVVATCDIGPATTITEDMVKEVQVSSDAVEVNALSSKEDAVGKCCPAQIVKGEQVLSNMLSDPGETGVRLSSQLKDGMYGMTIEVEVDAGVGGYVQAGDHVDILGATLDSDGNVISSGFIVENVEVIRVNEAAKEGENSYNYLTLTMTATQCATLYAYQAAIPSGSACDYHAILRSTGGTK